MRILSALTPLFIIQSLHSSNHRVCLTKPVWCAGVHTWVSSHQYNVPPWTVLMSITLLHTISPCHLTQIHRIVCRSGIEPLSTLSSNQTSINQLADKQ